MSKTYNKVVYDGDTLIDLTSDTVAPSTLAVGVTAHNAAGEAITGTMPTETNWGDIGGTLANQTDLQTELNAKANVATTLAGYGITDATISDGTITLGSNTLTPATLTSSDFNGSEKTSTVSDTSVTISTSNGPIQSCLSATSITMPSAVNGYTITLLVDGDALLSWSGDIKWSGGSAPDLDSGTCVITMIGVGGYWYGFYGGACS